MRIFLSILSLVFFSTAYGQLSISPAELDFGSRPQQQTFKEKVVLKNNSDKLIKILGVASDCACTASEPGLTQLGPGEQTFLTITMESRDYRGEVLRKVTLETNVGTFIIPVKMLVNPFGDWNVEQQLLVFPISKAAEEQEQKFKIYNRNQAVVADTRITSIWTDVSWLKVHFEPIELEGVRSAYMVHVKRLANAPTGNLGGIIKLTTTNPITPELIIPVRAAVRGELTVMPSMLTLGTARVGQTRSALFSIEGWRFDEPPQVLFPQGEVRFLGQEAGRLKYELRIKAQQPGILNTNALILRPKLADDKKETDRTIVELPVVIRVLDAN